jgi:class 3 adenylate cyclase
MGKDIHPLDQPFPLLRKYRRRILPGMLVFVLLLAGITALASVKVMRSIYLRMAEGRAEAIATLVMRHVPEAWSRLLKNDLRPGDPDWQAAANALDEAVAGARVARLKVYDRSGALLYGPDLKEVGTTEDNPILRNVLKDMDSGLTTVIEPDGTPLYELYVPLRGMGGNLAAVFELYEPTDNLDAVVLRNALVGVGVPSLLLALLVLALGRLVGSAQADIDWRTTELVSLRRRLESFLSDTAVGAARAAASDAHIPSRRVECAILYTDIRDFTGYSEQNSPEAVVDMLNRLLAGQVEAVRANGGDVDKFVGDAMLAWFEGPEAAARAVRAGRDLLAAVPADAPRRIGAGVYSGPVVSGAVGPQDRRDFTVIGDTVNTAARLCSVARADQLVVDSATLERAGEAAGGFGPAEEITVKGRVAPLAVRRLTLKGGRP